MKYAIVLAAATAAVTTVSAAPEPYKGFHGFMWTDCGRYGNGCVKKRDASPDPYKGFHGFQWTDCGRYGNGCVRDLPASVEKREASPEPYKGFHGFMWTDCGRYGNGCVKKREASPEPYKGFHGFQWTDCGRYGNGCVRDVPANVEKRDVAPAPWKGYLINSDDDDSVTKRSDDNGTQPLIAVACGDLGQACVTDLARSAEPEAHRQIFSAPGREGFKAACLVPGNPCSIVKRAALAVAAELSTVKPEVVSEKARRAIAYIGDLTSEVLNDIASFDSDPSFATMLANLAIPTSNSTVAAQRRSVSPCDLPGVECKEACFEVGAECSVLDSAKEAFHAAVRREAEAHGRLTTYQHSDAAIKHDHDQRYKFTHCGASHSCARDVAEAEQAKISDHADYAVAEEKCFAEDGECTAAGTYFANLQSALHQATAVGFQGE